MGEVSCSGRDYTVQMIDGTILKRHFSSLVSATANANQADVKLIDPFQLVDFKTRILPEHLYPKFRLQLDKFKDQNPNIDITDEPDENSIHSQLPNSGLPNSGLPNSGLPKSRLPNSRLPKS